MKKKSNDYIQMIEVNDKQGDFLEYLMYHLDGEGVKEAGAVAGIGAGKTVLLSIIMLISKEELPRAKGQFACLTQTQFKSSIFPSVKAVWKEKFGLREYNFETGQGDYVLWREPPKDWDRPYEEPEDWSKSISFPNGWVCEVCGYLMNADIHRGRSDDFAFLDEAFKFKSDWLTVLRGRIRANPLIFKSNLHHLFLYVSSPDWGVGGDWMFEIEESMKKNPRNYYFQQFTTYDNVVFLPKNYIQNLKKNLTKIRFEIEVLGKRLSKIPKSFYPAFDINKHAVIDSYIENKKWLIPTQEVFISCDFNAHFCCATIWQTSNKLMKCIGDAYVKECISELTMPESLAIVLAEKLKGKGIYKIKVTGDRNGTSNWAGLRKPQFELLADVLRANGISCEVEALVYNPLGEDKFNITHDVFSGKNYNILFDPIEAKSTIFSIIHTPIHSDYTKDKRSERKASVPQERATHLSDTVDYAIIYETKRVISSDLTFDMSFF